MGLFLEKNKHHGNHDSPAGHHAEGEADKVVNVVDQSRILRRYAAPGAKLHPGRLLEMLPDDCHDFMPGKTTDSAPIPVAAIMVCERCRKTCRCPYCNKP